MDTDVSNWLDEPRRLFFSVEEVAGLLGLSRRTIRRWVEEGRIEAIRTAPSPKGHLRISRSALHRYVAESSASALLEPAGKEITNPS